MPGFMLFGAGAGLMNVPLTNAIMDAAPEAQAGIASALMNASREVSGLLGVTIIGAVLSTVRASALRGGTPAPAAFLDGYHTGLWVTIGVLAAGVVLSYVTLRPRRSVPAPELLHSVGSSRTISHMVTGTREVVLTASELQWLRGREYLRENRHELGVNAADGYPSAARVAGTPLLAAPGWIPARPVPLGDISVALSPEAFPPRHNAVPHAVPENADGARYASYSDAMRSLDAPAIFENRALYRLTGADLSGPRPGLEFGRGRYFEAIDVGTAAAHEYAAEHAAASPGRAAPDASLGRAAPGHATAAAPDAAAGLRAAIGDPCDLAARPAMMAVATLTIRLDRGSGTATFPLHWRDPAKVGHAGGMYQVIPAGIFQPSGEAPWNWQNDFDLWRCMLREYAEELLGADEDHDSERGPIDYAAWPFAARMSALRAAGRIQAWCLGLGVDPLTFATDLLTVAVFDAAGYDELFGDLVRSNAEGTVIASWPFEEQAVTELIRDHPVQAARRGAAITGASPQGLALLLAAGASPPVPPCRLPPVSREASGALTPPTARRCASSSSCCGLRVRGAAGVPPGRRCQVISPEIDQLFRAEFVGANSRGQPASRGERPHEDENPGKLLISRIEGCSNRASAHFHRPSAWIRRHGPGPCM